MPHFYDCINTIYLFIKHFLDKKYLFLRNMEPFSNVERDVKCQTLRKYAYLNILKISPSKNENFQIKKSDIFQKHRLWILIRTASVRQF